MSRNIFGCYRDGEQSCCDATVIFSPCRMFCCYVIRTALFQDCRRRNILPPKVEAHTDSLFIGELQGGALPY